MYPHSVKWTTHFEASSQEVFDWHLNPAAFFRLVPPWEKVKVLSREAGPNVVGSQMVLKIKIGPFWARFVTQHQEFIEGKSFTDVQFSGPMKYWKHIHRVEPCANGGCTLVDEILFLPPFGILKQSIKKRLLRMIKWRHETLQNDLFMRKRYPKERLNILVTGSTGLVGNTLVAFLRTQGHDVIRLVRKKSKVAPDALFWNPSKGEIHIEDLEGFDAVFHLAGKNIASQKWNEAFKKELFQSRARDTWLLSQALTRLQHPPKVFICASAVGIYGDRKDEKLEETSSFGLGFLANLCIKWEEASKPLEQKGVRRVNTRFGLILSPKGGMLGKMLPLFRWGLGAIIGSGKQKMSWVTLDDVVYALYHCLLNPQVDGPVNLVAPNMETVESFSHKLARILKRPLFLRIGEKPLRMALGEMAEEMFLASTWAVPEKLQATGYTFFYPTLEKALKRQLS